ncbi:MAG: hypothetical protein Ta2G_20460 [Termitinemataceae bacterium]|nr:MAG: hypothetical protein Ta2G_20460 [Termitinemataceae bacterium]
MNRENLTRYIVLVPHKDSLKPLPLHLAIVEEALPAAHLKLIAERLRQKADIAGALQDIPHIKQLLTGTSTIDGSIPSSFAVANMVVRPVFNERSFEWKIGRLFWAPSRRRCVKKS